MLHTTFKSNQNTIKMLTTAQENPHVTTAEFNSLMNNRQLQTGDDLDSVGFECQVGNLCVTFYGEGPDHELIVEDFGRMKGGKWIQGSPTKSQKKRMQEIILLEVRCIKDNARREELEAASEQEEFDTYGYPGALYGKFY